MISGRPAPQGSHELGSAGQFRDSSPYLAAWRQAIKIEAFRTYQRLGIDPAALPVFGAGTPVVVELCTFFVGADQCRAEGTEAPIGPPDVDKFLRAMLDALGGAKNCARLFADDSQVVDVKRLSKVRADVAKATGAVITVSDGRD